MRGLIAVLVVILFGLQYRLWIGPGSFAEVDRLERRIELQQRENDQLTLRNERLAGEVRSLKSGLAAVEARARNDLGLIRRGETFYLVVEPRPPR